MNHKRIHTVAGQPGRFLCLLVVLSLLLGLMGPVQIASAQAVVTVDGAVSSGTDHDVNTISVSHTTGTGTNRLMLVAVSANNYTTAFNIVSVTFTYDSTQLELTEVGTQTDSGRKTAIYRLLAPPSGQLGTVTVDFSATIAYSIVVGVANFQGVDQTIPLGAFAGATGNWSGASPSLELTDLAGGELVFDSLYGGGQTSPTLVVGDNQSELWNVQGDQSLSGAGSTEQAAGSSVTMSWTSNLTSGVWIIGAVPINPVSGPTHDLTIAVDPDGSGTTDPAVGVHAYPEDDVVDITATANVGYVFSTWDGACTGTDPDVCQVTMDADKTVTANFAAQNYDLTMAVSPSGAGTTTPSVAGSPHSYGAGAVVDISATANSGYQFVDWTGDVADPNSASTTVIMDGNETVTANFTEVPGPYLDGAVSSNTADDVASIDIAHTTGAGADRLLLVGVSWNCGTTDRSIASVTFTPDGGSAITLDEVITEQTGTQYRYSAIYSWPDTPVLPSGQAGTVTVTFSGSVSNGIVAGAANFAGVDQTTPLGVSNGANGNSTAPSVDLTGLGGDELVFDNVFQGASGASQTLTPGGGQSELWTGFAGNARASASTERATDSSVTMSWTAANSSYWAIAAVAINPAVAGTTYELTVVVDPNEDAGTTVPSAGAHTYAENAEVDVTATAATGYEFDHWEGACTGTDPDVCQVTMDEDKTVTASFTALPQYALTVGTTGNGSVTLDPAGGTYYEDTTVTLTPEPGPCYTFDGWSGDDAGDIQGTGPYTILMDGDKSVTADFAALPAGTPCYRVNCGGDTLTVPDPDFLALHYPGSDTIPGLTVSNVQDERSTTDTIDMSNVDPGLPMELFQTILIRGTAGQTMSYDFTVPNGDYDVLLHFAEHYFSEAGQRAFDITVEDVLVFDDYDIFVAAGGEDIAVTESVPTTVDDGVLSLDITAQVSDAAIRGIEVVLAEGAVTCYELTLGHTGNGTDPVADLANSTGCPEGQYVDGETINLSGAAADLGWGIASWYGTGDDTSTGATNSVTMPASAHSAGVNYLRLLGDVDLSGDVDSTDALIVLTADVGLPTTAYCPMNYGDVNGDGLVNSSDALIILTYDVELPVGTFLVGQPVAEPVLTEQPPGCLLLSGGFSGWSWGLNP